MPKWWTNLQSMKMNQLKGLLVFLDIKIKDFDCYCVFENTREKPSRKIPNELCLHSHIQNIHMKKTCFSCPLAVKLSSSSLIQISSPASTIALDICFIYSNAWLSYSFV